MTDSTGQVSLLQSVETGDLSVAKGRIWLSSDQLPPVQLLHHLNEPSHSHRESASVCSTVTSQVKGLPRCHGISVKPAGRWPSCLANRTGVQSLLSGDSARRPFANEGMRATGINLSATNARIWNANVAPQPQTHCHTNGFIIQTETA